MIKKIYIVLFLLFVFTSCGKKSDPVYKGNLNDFKSTQNNNVVL